MKTPVRLVWEDMVGDCTYAAAGDLRAAVGPCAGCRRPSMLVWAYTTGETIKAAHGPDDATLQALAEEYLRSPQ